MGIFILYCVFFLTNEVRWVEAVRYDSEGFASRIWVESPTLSEVRNLGPNRVLYTNEPTLLYIRTGRQSYALPTSYDTALAQTRPEYDQEVERVNQELRSGKATLILLGREWLEDPGGADWYAQVTRGLRLTARFSDGEIFTGEP